jgi:hypothetical protein
MLTKHPLLAGKLVEAWTEDVYRRIVDENNRDEYFEQPRFRLVVDEQDRAIATVSNKYRLVRNADIVAALDIAADKSGLVLEPKRACYRNGRASYRFTAPTLGFRAGNDPSDTFPMVEISNDYRGGGGMRITSGFYRLICTNGAVRDTVAYQDNQHHIGDFSVWDFVEKAITRMMDVFEADRLLANTLAMTPVVAGQELVARMLEETAKRYRPDLERAVRENVLSIGDNMWAYVQAAAEVATHRMQEREHFNFAADPWASRMTELVTANGDTK